MSDIFEMIVEQRRLGRSAVLVTVVAKKGHGPTSPKGKMLVGAKGRLAGTVGGGAIEARALEESARLLLDGDTLLKDYLLDEGEGRDDLEATGMKCGGTVSLFYEVLAPARRAYLFGAGHIGQALAPLLASLGFAPTLIDCRAEYLDDTGMTAEPDYAAWPNLSGLDSACIVIATHSHVCDSNVLSRLLNLGVRPAYLGIVASTRKWQAISDGLRSNRGDDLDLTWVHSPAGLRLGGGTPPEIALSIAAEIQSVLTGSGAHDHMRERKQS